MQAYVDRGTYAGASTIVARRGVVVHEGHNGLRDKDAGPRMTEDTIFRLYSMTEPIVCTALMTLFEGAIPAPRSGRSVCTVPRRPQGPAG
jgi:CubicO group peptidase (beta-lactamase class C family)